MNSPKLSFFFGIIATATGLACPLQGQIVSNIVNILQQPEEQMVALGGPAQLSIKASGDSLGYQWIFRYQAIYGATNNVYKIKNVSLTDVGLYQCIVHSDNETAFSNPVMLSAHGPTISSNGTSTIVLWSHPLVWPGQVFTAPANPPPNVYKPEARFYETPEIERGQGPRIQFAALHRKPRMMFISTTNSAGTVFSPLPPVGLIGNLTGCGSYVGYVNFKKPSGAGWNPIPNVAHTAQDITRSDTCIKFFGSSIGNNGVGTGGFVNVTPISSSTYTFTVYFPTGPIPTNPYPLYLSGFQ